MNRFYFSTIGTNLGTRQLGSEVRDKLLSVLKENEKTVLDFSGVNVVSNSFADECLAKLLLTYSLDELKNLTTFEGLNDFARKNISVAFKRRYASLQ